MDQVGKRKNIIMLAIITIIVVYIAVSVYWIIRDIDTGQTVFVISSSLPKTGDANRENYFLEKIKGFFIQNQVMVPIEKKVTIKGRVVYTNGSPFAHGLVELRSEPRRTYTDSDGYFIFEDVEDGEHTISVLSQNGEVLASCKVVINRNIEIKDVVLVKMADGTFVLEVAVDVKVLEIVLEIELNDTGQPTGRLVIQPKVKVLENYTPEKYPGTSAREDENIPDSPIPDQPDPSPGKPWGDQGASNPLPSAGDLTVYSTVDNRDFNKAPAPAADINIFGSSKRIAPGMTGVYRFTVDNTANPFAIYYDIDFIETNNKLNIPMKYRLRNITTNSYVSGDLKWHTIREIRAAIANPEVPLSMNRAMKTDYVLEWFWDDGGQTDNSYAEKHAGKVVCTLTIRVSAQRK